MRLESCCMEQASTSEVQLLDRAAALLFALEGGPLTLAELVNGTGLARATAHRLATALECHGLVSRDGNGRWELAGARGGRAALRVGGAGAGGGAGPGPRARSAGGGPQPPPAASLTFSSLPPDQRPTAPSHHQGVRADSPGRRKTMTNSGGTKDKLAMSVLLVGALASGCGAASNTPQPNTPVSAADTAVTTAPAGISSSPTTPRG